MTGHHPPNRPGWLLDEMTCIGRENLDASHVSRYDSKEDADADAELAFLREAGVPRQATVVDLGAGTGQFALAAADWFHRVVAVDPSPVMLERLAASAGARPSPPEIVRGGFLSYEHEGAAPDLVYTRYALHHLPDFWKAVALGRLRDLLAPHGLLRLWDVVYHFPIDEAGARVERWCATGSSSDDGRWTRAELEEHVRDEHSTFTWLLEPMFEQAGFEIRDACYADDGFSARYLLAVAQRRRAGAAPGWGACGSSPTS